MFSSHVNINFISFVLILSRTIYPIRDAVNTLFPSLRVNSSLGLPARHIRSDDIGTAAAIKYDADIIWNLKQALTALPTAWTLGTTHSR